METANISETQEIQKNRLRRRWLKLWREWGCPRFTLELSLSGLTDDDIEGHIGDSELAARYAGEPFELSGHTLRAFRVLAFGRDVASLIAELANVPHANNTVYMPTGAGPCQDMAHLCNLVRAAHHDAAWHFGDIEALRALDAPFISEEIALLESLLLERIETKLMGDTETISQRKNLRRI